MIRRTTTRSVVAIVAVALMCASLGGFAPAPLLPMLTQRVNYVVNNTNEPIIVTKVDTSPNRWNYEVFEAHSPQVGDVIQPNQTYAFEMILYAFSNSADVKVSARNQSSTGFASISAKATNSNAGLQGCEAFGTIACADKRQGTLVKG